MSTIMEIFIRNQQIHSVTLAQTPIPGHTKSYYFRQSDPSRRRTTARKQVMEYRVLKRI